MRSSWTIVSLCTTQTLRSKTWLGTPWRHSYKTNNVPCSKVFCHIFSNNEHLKCLQLSHVLSATHFHNKRRKCIYLSLACLFLPFFYFNGLGLKLTDISKQHHFKQVFCCSPFQVTFLKFWVMGYFLPFNQSTQQCR